MNQRHEKKQKKGVNKEREKKTKVGKHNKQIINMEGRSPAPTHSKNSKIGGNTKNKINKNNKDMTT